MKPNGLGYLALSAFSALFLLGCPQPVDMHDPEAAGGSSGSGGRGGSSAGSSGGSSGSSSGGSSGGGTGGSSGSTTGGSSGSGSGGSSGGMGGRGGAGGTSGGMGGRGGSTGSGGSMARGGSSGADAGGGMEMGGGAAISFKTDVAPLMMGRCTNCHAMATAAAGYAWLQANAAAGRACAGRKRQDVLLSKVDAMMMPACGAKMPLPAGTAQSAELATKLKDWIAAGAPNN